MLCFLLLWETGAWQVGKLPQTYIRKPTAPLSPYWWALDGGKRTLALRSFSAFSMHHKTLEPPDVSVRTVIPEGCDAQRPEETNVALETNMKGAHCPMTPEQRDTRGYSL